MNAVRALVNGFLDLIWPRVCFLCEQPFHETNLPACLCKTCLSALSVPDSPTCPRCASTVGPHTNLEKGCLRCRNRKFHFERVIRLNYYDGRLRDVILKMKHESGEPLAEVMGEILANSRLTQQVQQIDAIIPIPLHWRRRWHRGYNQSQSLARGVAKVLKTPLQERWLIRTRATPSQQGQSAEARWENLRGAFRVPEPLKNMRILLIDDVLTTGATADAASTALLQAGAAQVIVAVLAHR